MDAGHTHYTPSGGLPDLKKAICAAYERDYGLKYEPTQCLVSNGAKHSIHNVLAALAERGAEPTRLTTHHATLEDVFVSLTGRTLRDA